MDKGFSIRERTLNSSPNPSGGGGEKATHFGGIFIEGRLHFHKGSFAMELDLQGGSRGPVLLPP